MNLEILKHTVFENIDNSNGLFTKHFHETYTIGLTHEGLFKSVNSNVSSLSYKSSTRVINPYEIHYGDSKSWKYTNFYPSVELLSKIYEDIFFEKKVPIFQKHIIEDIQLYNLLLKLFQSIYNELDTMQVETDLINALSYLIKEYTHTTKKYDNLFDEKKIVTNSTEYINDSLDSNISLDEIAKQSSLSKYHFLRVFKKNIGLTPHSYIVMQRINKAKELIIHGQSLMDASINVGFSDQSHFIRNFRKMYGYSPKTLLRKEQFVTYK